MGNKPEKPKKGEERFILTYQQSNLNGSIQIWVDKKTGVNYISGVGSGIGLTPLLDAEGNPIITLIEK